MIRYRGPPPELVSAGLEAGIEQAMAGEAGELLGLDPESSRAFFLAAHAAMLLMLSSTEGGESRIQRMVPALCALSSMYVRALELGREQGSNYWVAAVGYCYATLAAHYAVPTLHPPAAAALAEEADAARRRCLLDLPQ